MRKKSCQKLALHRETIRHLETPELRNAFGALGVETDSVPSCIDGCPTVFTCDPETIKRQ